MSRAARAGLAVLAAVLACAPPAHAEAVTSPVLRTLAARAERDPGARERLAGIDRVDGRPIAIGRILEGARPDEVAARVELAVDSAQGAGQAGGNPRTAARDLLRDRRYTGTSVPRPFAGALRWLGERLDPVARRFDRTAGIFAGSVLLSVLLGAVVLLVAFGLSLRFIRRRAGGAGGTARRGRAATREDPAALERAAAEAERREDFAAGVRLRFRAGLLRLDAAEVIAYRPSLTTGEVARAVRSPDFDRLGRDFDAIAYGDRRADAEAAASARQGWEAVLR